MKKAPSHRPKQMEFIEQRRKSDCGIACAAMICDRLYGEVVAISQALGISIGKNGIQLDKMFELLEEFNYNCCKVEELPGKGRALVAIHWKDNDLSGHYVVWDGKRGQFLDPLHGAINKREMMKFANIESLWECKKS